MNDDISSTDKKGKIDTKKINKYVNPKISSSHYLVSRNIAIGNSIKKIETYIDLTKKLENAISMDSIKLNFVRN